MCAPEPTTKDATLGTRKVERCNYIHVDGLLAGGTVKLRRCLLSRGFASMQEDWHFDLDAAKHMQEVDEDVARHAAAHPHPQRKARLRRKLGGRTARTPCWIERNSIQLALRRRVGGM
eukprot:4163157-Amphidinium_carterae.1